MYVCMYVCLYARMLVSMHVCTVRSYACIQLYVSIYKCMYVYTQERSSTCVHMGMCEKKDHQHDSTNRE